MVGSALPAGGGVNGSLLDAMENAVAVVSVAIVEDLVVDVVVEVNVVIVDFDVVMIGVLEGASVLVEVVMVDISSTSL